MTEWWWWSILSGMTDAETLVSLKDEWVKTPSRRAEIQGKIDALEDRMKRDREDFIEEWEDADREDRERSSAIVAKEKRRRGFEEDYEADLRRRQTQAWERQRYEFVVPGHRAQPDGYGGTTMQGIPDALTPLHWSSGYRIHRGA